MRNEILLNSVVSNVILAYAMEQGDKMTRSGVRKSILLLLPTLPDKMRGSGWQGKLGKRRGRCWAPVCPGLGHPTGCGAAALRADAFDSALLLL